METNFKLIRDKVLIDGHFDGQNIFTKPFEILVKQGVVRLYELTLIKLVGQMTDKFSF